jgi:hypothetical protein
MIAWRNRVEKQQQPCSRGLDLQTTVELIRDPLERVAAGEGDRARHHDDDNAGGTEKQSREPAPVTERDRSRREDRHEDHREELHHGPHAKRDARGARMIGLGGDHGGEDEHRGPEVVPPCHRDAGGKHEERPHRERSDRAWRDLRDEPPGHDSHAALRNREQPGERREIWRPERPEEPWGGHRHERERRVLEVEPEVGDRSGEESIGIRQIDSEIAAGDQDIALRRQAYDSDEDCEGRHEEPDVSQAPHSCSDRGFPNSPRPSSRVLRAARVVVRRVAHVLVQCPPPETSPIRAYSLPPPGPVQTICALAEKTAASILVNSSSEPR